MVPGCCCSRVLGKRSARGYALSLVQYGPTSSSNHLMVRPSYRPSGQGGHLRFRGGLVGQGLSLPHQLVGWWLASSSLVVRLEPSRISPKRVEGSGSVRLRQLGGFPYRQQSYLGMEEFPLKHTVDKASLQLRPLLAHCWIWRSRRSCGARRWPCRGPSG